VSRPRAAAFLLCAALSGAGCGGEDEEADRFREGYNAAVERLNEVNANIEESGRELAARPGPEIAREFERIADTAARTRADLRRLEPPDDARDEFGELLTAIGEGVEDIRGVASAARKGDQDRFSAATERLSETSQEISRAEEALKDAVGG
jgi:methyl-accepting chemotaxis protein